MPDINFNDTYDELSNLATDTDNMVKSDGTAREKLDFITVAKKEFGDLISDDWDHVIGYKNIDDIALNNFGQSIISNMISMDTDVDLAHLFDKKTKSDGELTVKDTKDLTYEEQKKLIDLIKKIIVPFEDIKKHCPEFDFKIGLHQGLHQGHNNDLYIEVFVDEYVAAPALDKWPFIISNYDDQQWLKRVRDDLVKAAARDLEAEKEKAKKAYERQLAKMEKQHQDSVAKLKLFDKLNLIPADTKIADPIGELKKLMKDN